MRIAVKCPLLGVKTMTKLKEFTGILRIEMEVTLPASSKEKALELLENIYPAITLSYGDEMPNLLDWRDNIDYADWELED
jgi:hypothetical protein